MSASHPLYQTCNRRWLKPLLGVLALITLLAEIFVHLHAYFDFAAFFGYNGLAGLVATLALIGIALLLAMLLRRPEGYYDD